MTVTVYGASDDLIEVEGDISEEFSDEKAVLGFSDGTLLSIEYTTDGFWRIAPIHRGSADLEVRQATDVDDDYSDRATLTGDIEWVSCGYIYAKASS